MFLINVVLFSAVGFNSQLHTLDNQKEPAPVLRTAKLNYQIQEDIYHLDEDWSSCVSASRDIKSGTLEVPVYDLTNGGGISSSAAPVQITLEDTMSHASENVVINFSTVIANLKSAGAEGVGTQFRKFFASNVRAEDPSTHKPFRTQGLEVYTNDLNTESIEGWIGVSTPDLDLGEECKGRGFSIWVSFDDAIPSKKQN